jgi:hypothetical protein
MNAMTPHTEPGLHAVESREPKPIAAIMPAVLARYDLPTKPQPQAHYRTGHAIKLLEQFAVA